MMTNQELALKAGVTRQAVWRAKKTGRLPKDLAPDHPDVLAFIELHRGSPAAKTSGVRAPPSVDHGNPERDPTDADADTDSMSRTEAERQKVVEQAKGLRLKNQEKRGSLIDRNLVLKAVEITDSEHHRLLADGAKTITKTIYDLAKSGAPLEEGIETFRKEMSMFMKSWKEKMSRSLAGFYTKES